MHSVPRHPGSSKALGLRASADGYRGGSHAQKDIEAARQAERLGQASAPRPQGTMLWLHASAARDEKPLVELARRIATAHPDVSILLTSENALPRGCEPLPPRTVHQLVPNEASRPIAAFLDHWTPDFAIWAGVVLRPSLIHAAADRDLKPLLIGASKAPETGRGWRRLTGVTRATLRRFHRILATGGDAARDLTYSGADRDRVEAIGPFEEEAVPLPCNLGERDSMASVLKAKPVWLAVDVTPHEEEAVLDAHQSAARLAHRLLLILSPSDPARGPVLAARAGELGLSVALRSVEGEPESGTEVFVADSEGDLGLWYRLAPITFMGGTLDPAGGGGRSPMEPAALGSAIVHGPFAGPHEETYNRFEEAGASRSFVRASELGSALSFLLSPDKSAAMAHSAWKVSTSGAALTERILGLLADELATRGMS